MKNIENKVSNNTINYSGKVTVSLVDLTGKVISSYSGHNDGQGELFNFLASCLAGNYKEADLSRPQYVRVFSLGQGGVTPVPDIGSTSYNNEKTMSPILANTTVALNNTDHTATFKFMVPCSRLYLVQNEDINLYGIYGASNKASASTPSAYFIVKDTTDPTKVGAAIDISTVSSDPTKYNLLIKWTMKVGS